MCFSGIFSFWNLHCVLKRMKTELSNGAQLVKMWEKKFKKNQYSENFKTRNSIDIFKKRFPEK